MNTRPKLTLLKEESFPRPITEPKMFTCVLNIKTIPKITETAPNIR